ncbi:MAG: hypothetical protein QG641_866, partial [Candidatus Poribacteria bacterium]|nr:hypothetical protein [Candidatus Poribacteria bacterium]
MYILRIALLMMFLWLCISAAFAQEGQVVFPLNDDYIKEWLVIGPFYPDNIKTDFLANIGGEENIQPKEGDIVTTSDGKTLDWKRYKAESNIVSFNYAIGYHEYATSYAFCILQSKVAGDFWAYFGNDNGAMVWINGEQVHNNPGNGAVICDQNRFDVKLKAGANKCLIKVVNQTEGWGFAMRIESAHHDRATLSGVITDKARRPVFNAFVCLEEKGLDIAETWTDAFGRYRISIYPVSGPYDLSVTNGDLGDWRIGIPIQKKENVKLDLTLREAISISGRILKENSNLPQENVMVQAVAINNDEVNYPKFIAGEVSDKRGMYRFINLKPGRYQVRCQIPGGDTYYKKGKNSVLPLLGGTRSVPPLLGGTKIEPILQIGTGKAFENVDFYFYPS